MKLKIGEQIFEVEILNLNARPIQVRVDGELFEVYPEEAAAIELPKTNASAPVVARSQPAGGSTSLSVVTAPIPGVITVIKVKPGDAVSVGQELCLVEAMKMNNPIRATRAGTIKTVFATVGQQIKYRDALVEYE